METSQDIHIHIIPVYYKRRIEYRPEVAVLDETMQIYYPFDDGEWRKFPYNDNFPDPNFLTIYETQEAAIKAAQDFVETLKAQ